MVCLLRCSLLSSSDGIAKEENSLCFQRASSGSEQVLSLLLYFSCGWVLPAPEEVVMWLLSINTSFNPRTVTLKIAVNINHLHLSTWHFGKIRQPYQKPNRLTWICLIFFFFLSIFMGQRFKKAQLLFNENSRQCISQTENCSPIPFWETWILKSQFLLGNFILLFFIQITNIQVTNCLRNWKRFSTWNWHKNPFCSNWEKKFCLMFLNSIYNTFPNETKCISYGISIPLSFFPSFLLSFHLSFLPFFHPFVSAYILFFLFSFSPTPFYSWIFYNFCKSWVLISRYSFALSLYGFLSGSLSFPRYCIYYKYISDAFTTYRYAYNTFTIYA